ncbi:uncharacterized protein LOC127807819 isoform X1 [Diospyros lotus]|uniref:uncharacterized protein LOC127807819 isoform X1 n=1 Tax=Diospyros lotus TaxID=55363 RepID=UPI002253D1F0|nr:uncharacterized protein LOC127807819 isoform X1 [Diospyros lotus]XP_052201903.1 uncharacterized protein LOC127807819 isoform X1 [Diospyros lotus]
MHLPWKHSKSKRISNLVADHLHPPKRGGSLPVETGFPTSLVDLFHKNRDRLKKRSKKKRLEKETPDPIPIPPRRSSSSSLSPTSTAVNTASSSRPPNSPPVLPTPPVSPATGQTCSPERVDDEIKAANERAEVNGEAVDRNRVFLVILKMFLVVVLALGTKKFVVGIIMSASLLLFMEYAGKHLCRMATPCMNAKKSIQFFMERVLFFLGIKRQKLKMEATFDQEETAMLVSASSSFSEEGRSNRGRIQEIQFVQSNYDCGSEGKKTNDTVQEIQDLQPGPNVVPPTRRIQIVREEMGKNNIVLEKEEAYKSHKTHRGKIRSKMKILVKKFHGSKKKQSTSKNEACGSVADDKADMGEIEHTDDGMSCELQHDDYAEGGQNCGLQCDAICSSNEPPRVKTKDGKAGKHVNKKRNSGNLIVFVIVLVGLVQGRTLAFALIMSWYLLVKLGRSLWRYIKGDTGDVSNSK